MSLSVTPSKIRSVRLLTLAAMSLGFAGCYSMNGYMMNTAGQSSYQQGNYAVAAQEFQTALANDPRNPDYLANLARTKSKMGETQTAEQLFRSAIAASPSHQPSYHGLAELMVAQGRSEEATQLLTNWTATQPYIAESYVELAWLQRELGQPHAAGQTLQRAIQVNPAHATALAHLGQYYQDTGRPADAMRYYQQSLQSNFSQPEVHSRLTQVAQAAGPQHPMSEMAMSRGAVPQGLAAAPPWATPQPQPQVAMPGLPQQPVVGMPGPQLAGTQPQFGGPQFGGPQMPPTTFTPSPFAPAPNGINSTPPLVAGYPYQPGSALPPNSLYQTYQPPANFGQPAPIGALPMGSTGGVITENPLPISPISSGTALQPSPDPQFSEATPSGSPITPISHSAPAEPALPEVTAF